MIEPKTTIISASRRTDIPAFYTPWFIEGVNKGFFRVKKPFTRKTELIQIIPDNIHSIVFWSKNYGPFLKLKADKLLSNKGFNLYFHFTLNSEVPEIEPRLPPLSERLKQMEMLTRRFGHDKVTWRFDPICSFKSFSGHKKNNLKDFPTIADRVAMLGVSKCVISFYKPYLKVEKRISFLKSQGKRPVEFIPLTQNKRILIIKRMAHYLAPINIQLSLCCERDLFKTIKSNPSLYSNHNAINHTAEIENLKENACIDSELLKNLFGGNPISDSDRGQRFNSGCNCTKSIDIGSYYTHTCYHNCLFCYARTGIDIHRTGIDIQMKATKTKL